MKVKILFAVIAALVVGMTIAPVATTYAYNGAPVAYPDPAGEQAEFETVLPAGYESYYYQETPADAAAYRAGYGEPYAIAQQLDITLDTSALFTGAQTMIDALSSPYLLIAGFGLGVAILAAIMKAVTTLRL
jgi:hypothetical protein